MNFLLSFSHSNSIYLFHFEFSRIKYKINYCRREHFLIYNIIISICIVGENE